MRPKEGLSPLLLALKAKPGWVSWAENLYWSCLVVAATLGIVLTPERSIEKRLVTFTVSKSPVAAPTGMSGFVGSI